jgi:hypothetical protein
VGKRVSARQVVNRLGLLSEAPRDAQAPERGEAPWANGDSRGFVGRCRISEHGGLPISRKGYGSL